MSSQYEKFMSFTRCRPLARGAIDNSGGQQLNKQQQQSGFTITVKLLSEPQKWRQKNLRKISSP
jgi:hypothetical protein